jgi:predicted alpha-1,6-mannanase (GH76 family)
MRRWPLAIVTLLAQAAVASVLAGASSCGDDAAGTASTSDASDSADQRAGDGAAAADAPALPDAVTDGGDARRLELHRRANEALESMLLHYWSQDDAYLAIASPRTTKLAGYWIFAQGFDVVLDGVERSAGKRFRGTLETFYEAQSTRGWSADFYDDENWMALALMRAFDLTGNTAYLARAESLFTDIMAAWDTTCCGSVPGGVWWDRAHTQKATASNEGAVVTGARLYEHTKKTAYLDFAKQVHTYWTANMIDASHQVADHIAPNGTITRWKFTYNEGLAIGASVALARATGDAKYLGLAHDVAGFMLASESKATPAGPVLFDGDAAACTGDCAQFKGIGARYLALLFQEDKTKSAYSSLLDTSGESAWTQARDPLTGLFGVDWVGPSSSKGPLEATSSAAQGLHVAAQLAGPGPAAPPADAYQAEEAVLHHVGLEAQNAGYEGWGYVAGWNKDGQWVDFKVSVPSAGTYDLDFRYAAGAGDAARLVFVNGQNVVPNEGFPATAAWTTYRSDVVPKVTLPAGDSVVSLVFNASLGSKAFLNLDRLTVVKSP